MSASPLPSATKAVALTTGTISATPGTAAAAATLLANGIPFPAVTWRSARPETEPMTSVKAARTARFSRSIAQIPDTPSASAMTDFLCIAALI